MLDLRRMTRLSAFGIAAALVAAACGSSNASPSTAPSSEVSSAPSVETPSEAPSKAPASEAPAASMALPTVDLSALARAIPGLDSYRTSTSVGGVKQYESVVVAKPVLSKAITIFDGGEISKRVVIIGAEAWSADGPDGVFKTETAVQATTDLMAYDPALMLAVFTTIDWAHAASDQGTEEKNGVQARHVRIDATTLLGAGGPLPAGSAIDAWVADAGYLVAWEMSGFPEGANFSIQVTGVNDLANKVERPS